jgi:alkylation response protein AidB-like acyl-CoA dehydrogenase
MPGIRVGKVEEKMGIRGSQTVELIIDDLHVPAANRIGAEGDGMKLAMQALDSGRLIVASQSNGAARAALDICVDFCKNRIENGKSISTQQGVAFKLAELSASLEAAVQMTRHGATLKDAHEPYSVYSAKTKLFCTENAISIIRECLDLMATYGFSKESSIEKIWRDCRIQAIYEGTSQIQRLVVAHSLFGKKEA